MMTCQQILSENVIEKYLLNKLDESEKKDFESHIEKCDSCRNEYQHERILVLGVRKYGREELRNRLRNDIREYKEAHKKTDWTIFYKAAAVLFFLALVPGIIYFNTSYEPFVEKTSSQISPGQIETEEISDAADDAEPINSIDKAPEKDILETQSPATPLSSKEEIRSQPEESVYDQIIPRSAQKSGEGLETAQSYGLTTLKKSAAKGLKSDAENFQRVQAGDNTIAFVSLAGSGENDTLPFIQKQQEIDNITVFNVYFPGNAVSRYQGRLPVYSVLSDSIILAILADSSRFIIDIKDQSASIRAFEQSDSSR